MEVTLGVLQSIDTYKDHLVMSEKQPWIGVDEASQKPFDYIGLRGRFTLSAALNSRLRATAQTGTNLRIAENLGGYRHTYVTLPLQCGLAYTVIKGKSYALAVQAYSGVNIFSIHNYWASQQTGALHSAELSYQFRLKNHSKSFVNQRGV
jgi:hypothetical protein